MTERRVIDTPCSVCGRPSLVETGSDAGGLCDLHGAQCRRGLCACGVVQCIEVSGALAKGEAALQTLRLFEDPKRLS